MNSNNLHISNVFESVLTNAEKQHPDAEKIALIKTMADFARSVYITDPDHNADYIKINEVSQRITKTHQANIPQDWIPSNFSSIVSDIDTNKPVLLNNGFYINGDATAFIARWEDAIVIAFRGTNNTSYELSKIINPENIKKWYNMHLHYALFEPLITAVDTYVENNGINKVYVTGHSMGGAMVLEYMSRHQGMQYQAVTFAASPFVRPYQLCRFLKTTFGYERKNYPLDQRILQVELAGDPITQVFDEPNLLGRIKRRPGCVLYFDKDKINYTTKEPDYCKANDNHSMNSYRQIIDRADVESWDNVLAETKKQRNLPNKVFNPLRALKIFFMPHKIKL